MLHAEEFQQPINFSHKSHVTKSEIPCEYCHSYARRSEISGLPSMQDCMGCHKVVKGETEPQQKQIAILQKYWDQKRAPAWKKIHDLPDFVYFSHKRHIRAGFDCTECHGAIADQELITMDNMANDLSMGWCLSCHKEAHPATGGKVIRMERLTRGGMAKSDIGQKVPDGTISGVKDCYGCHK